jgi:hypothetical protein
MGACFTINLKVKPKKVISEQSYRCDPKVQFADKNIFHSDPNMLLSVENLERKAKVLLMSRLNDEEFEKNRLFIEELTKELLRAKGAIDDCLYNDIHSRNSSYSIVPYVELDRSK